LVHFTPVSEIQLEDGDCRGF
jgi:hypothetical protein